MVDVIVGLAIVTAAVFGPLAWLVWRDHQAERALALRAVIQAAMNRRLGGEALISLQVTPPTPWRVGRVVLMAPSDWEWLVDEVLMLVLERLPAGYELVVRPAVRSAPLPRTSSTPLPQPA